MSVSVGDTLEDAVGRLMTVPGLLVLVLFAVFRLTNPVIYNTVFARGADFVLEKAGGYSLRDVEIELVERGYGELLPLVDMIVSGLFVRQRIALAGDGIFEALSESYDLVTQNALQMVALVVVFWLTWVVTTFIAGMIPLGGRGGRASAASAGQSDSLGA